MELGGKGNSKLPNLQIELKISNMSFLNHSFNSLPAKPEHTKKVIFVLTNLVDATERQIIQESGLTKTQTICVLNDLMNKNLVLYDKKSKKFNLIIVSQN